MDSEMPHVLLEVDDGGYLSDPRWECGPTPRTWERCLEDVHGLASLTAEARADLLQEYELTEGDLAEEAPFESLLAMFPEESLNGSAFCALAQFEGEPALEGLVRFIENDYFGSDFRGVEVIGSRLDLNRELAGLGLSFRIADSLLWDELGDEAKTPACRQLLKDAQENGGSPEEYVELVSAEKRLLEMTPEEWRRLCDNETNDGDTPQGADERTRALARALLNEHLKRQNEEAALAPFAQQIESRMKEFRQNVSGGGALGRMMQTGRFSSRLREYILKNGSMPPNDFR